MKPTVKDLLKGHENDLRKCARCGKYKPYKDFNLKVRTNKNSYSLAFGYCKKCANHETVLSHRMHRGSNA